LRARRDGERERERDARSRGSRGSSSPSASTTERSRPGCCTKEGLAPRSSTKTRSSRERDAPSPLDAVAVVAVGVDRARCTGQAAEVGARLGLKDALRAGRVDAVALRAGSVARGESGRDELGVGAQRGV